MNVDGESSDDTNHSESTTTYLGEGDVNIFDFGIVENTRLMLSTHQSWAWFLPLIPAFDTQTAETLSRLSPKPLFQAFPGFVRRVGYCEYLFVRDAGSSFEFVNVPLRVSP
jgi:hypothetical protein